MASAQVCVAWAVAFLANMSSEAGRKQSRTTGAGSEASVFRTRREPSSDGQYGAAAAGPHSGDPGSGALAGMAPWTAPEAGGTGWQRTSLPTANLAGLTAWQDGAVRCGPPAMAGILDSSEQCGPSSPSGALVLTWPEGRYSTWRAAIGRSASGGSAPCRMHGMHAAHARRMHVARMHACNNLHMHRKADADDHMPPMPARLPPASARMLPCAAAQEEMYSFVTVSEDQTTKGKGTTLVQDA